MAEAYSKLCEISKMMRYIENIPHHSLFKHFQGYSGTFSTVEPSSGILRDIKSF